MFDAMLMKNYEQNESVCRKERKSELGRLFSTRAFYGYCHTHAFLEDHGGCDPEKSGNEFAKWLFANRKFFVGGKFLEDHAKQLGHPASYCGLAAWHPDALTTDQRNVFWALRRMASKNMHLMCLDNASFGVGWAALGAGLGDEIFLVPACSSPVILRRHETDGNYKFVGDAIVIGAMENEVWGNTTCAGLIEIKIH